MFGFTLDVKGTYNKVKEIATYEQSLFRKKKLLVQKGLKS